MKKAKKKNRKYLIGGGQVNTMFKLDQKVVSMLMKGNYSPNDDLKIRFCGKTKLFNVAKYKRALGMY